MERRVGGLGKGGMKSVRFLQEAQLEEISAPSIRYREWRNWPLKTLRSKRRVGRVVAVSRTLDCCHGQCNQVRVIQSYQEIRDPLMELCK